MLETPSFMSLQERYVRLALAVAGSLAVAFAIAAALRGDLVFAVSAVFLVVLVAMSVWQLWVGRPDLATIVGIAGAFVGLASLFLPLPTMLAVLLAFALFAAAAAFLAGPWMSLWFGAVIIGAGVVTILRSESSPVVLALSLVVLAVGNGIGGLFHRQAGQLLKVQARRWNTLMDSSVDAVLAVDRTGTIVIANRGAWEMFEYVDSSDLVGRPLNDLLPARYRGNHPGLVAGFAALPVEARPMSALQGLKGLRKSGVKFPVDVSIAKLDDGEALVMAIVRDVTDREARIHEIETVSQARIELMASVAHEVRTPLSSVLGFADLLNTESASLTRQEQEQAIRAIAEGATEMTHLVEDLLVGARAEIGQLVVARVPVDIRAQVAQVLEAIHVAATVGVVGEVVATGDPGRVRQILRNLLTNAVRHGGPDIRVDVDVDDSVCIVAVSDLGPELSEEDRAGMFIRFEKRVQDHGLAGPVGIGLPLSRDLARRMGGDVTYRHEVGRNVFDLRLPRWDSDDR